MCALLLPPGVKPIAVNNISYNYQFQYDETFDSLFGLEFICTLFKNVNIRWPFREPYETQKYTTWSENTERPVYSHVVRKVNTVL